MLLAGEDATEIAKTLRINRHTLFEWMRKPLFLKVLNQKGNDFLDSCMATVKVKLLKAVEVLERNLDAEKPADQIKAATNLINTVLRAHEITVLKKEFAELGDLKCLVNQLTQGEGLNRSEVSGQGVRNSRDRNQ
jgi:hypothetical protein